MTLQTQISPLVGSRICHDLINPLGAISNGVELLSMTPGLHGPEMSLIAESIEAANARIRFFRVAYGASTQGQVLEDPEITGILAGMGAGGRHHMVWSAPGAHPRDEVRLVFLLIQCLETAMPYGGRIEVSGHSSAWVIRGSADRFAEIDDLWGIILRDEDAGDVAAAHVQFPLAAMLEADMDLQVSMTTTADAITLAVRAI